VCLPCITLSFFAYPKTHIGDPLYLHIERRPSSGFTTVLQDMLAPPCARETAFGGMASNKPLLLQSEMI
jgi:hypothetical protein